MPIPTPSDFGLTAGKRKKILGPEDFGVGPRAVLTPGELAAGGRAIPEMVRSPHSLLGDIGETAKGTFQTIVSDTAGTLRSLKGARIDQSISQGVTALGAGILAFTADMLGRVEETIRQFAFKGFDIDFNQVKALGELRAKALEYHPDDPGAVVLNEFVAAVPQGLKAFATAAADIVKTDDPSSKRTITADMLRVVGDAAELYGFGKVFHALKEVRPTKAAPKLVPEAVSDLPRQPKGAEFGARPLKALTEAERLLKLKETGREKGPIKIEGKPKTIEDRLTLRLKEDIGTAKELTQKQINEATVRVGGEIEKTERLILEAPREREGRIGRANRLRKEKLETDLKELKNTRSILADLATKEKIIRFRDKKTSAFKIGEEGPREDPRILKGIDPLIQRQIDAATTRVGGIPGVRETGRIPKDKIVTPQEFMGKRKFKFEAARKKLASKEFKPVRIIGEEAPYEGLSPAKRLALLKSRGKALENLGKKSKLTVEEGKTLKEHKAEMEALDELRDYEEELTGVSLRGGDKKTFLEMMTEALLSEKGSIDKPENFMKWMTSASKMAKSKGMGLSEWMQKERNIPKRMADKLLNRWDEEGKKALHAKIKKIEDGRFTKEGHGEGDPVLKPTKAEIETTELNRNISREDLGKQGEIQGRFDELKAQTKRTAKESLELKGLEKELKDIVRRTVVREKIGAKQKEVIQRAEKKLGVEHQGPGIGGDAFIIRKGLAKDNNFTVPSKDMTDVGIAKWHRQSVQNFARDKMGRLFGKTKDPAEAAFIHEDGSMTKMPSGEFHGNLISQLYNRKDLSQVDPFLKFFQETGAVRIRSIISNRFGNEVMFEGILPNELQWKIVRDLKARKKSVLYGDIIIGDRTYGFEIARETPLPNLRGLVKLLKKKNLRNLIISKFAPVPAETLDMLGFQKGFETVEAFIKNMLKLRAQKKKGQLLLPPPKARALGKHAPLPILYENKAKELLAEQVDRRTFLKGARALGKMVIKSQFLPIKAIGTKAVKKVITEAIIPKTVKVLPSTVAKEIVGRFKVLEKTLEKIDDDYYAYEVSNVFQDTSAFNEAVRKAEAAYNIPLKNMDIISEMHNRLADGGPRVLDSEGSLMGSFYERFHERMVKVRDTFPAEWAKGDEKISKLEKWSAEGYMKMMYEALVNAEKIKPLTTSKEVHTFLKNNVEELMNRMYDPEGEYPTQEIFDSVKKLKITSVKKIPRPTQPIGPDRVTDPSRGWLATGISRLKEKIRGFEALAVMDNDGNIILKIEDGSWFKIGTEKKTKTVTTDMLGLQTGFEKATEMIADIRAKRLAKIKAAVDRERRAFLTSVEGSPLDKANIAYLKEGNFDKFVKALPSIGDLTIKEVEKLFPETGFATIGTRREPAIRKSGFHALAKFKNELKGAKDVSKRDVAWADPTRGIQAIDQGKFGGPAQRYILWPTRLSSLARIRWVEEHKVKLREIAVEHKIKNRKRSEAIGDVIELIEKGDEKVQNILKLKATQKFLKAFKPEIQKDIVVAALKTRKLFNDLIKMQNQVREVRNQKPIEFRANYRPWVIKANLWSKLLGYRVTPKEIMESPSMPDFIKPNKPFIAHDLAREGLLAKYPKERGIIKLTSDYIESAGRDIFDTNVVHNNKIHAKVLKGMGLENSANFVETWTAEAYAGALPRITKAAAEIFPPQVRASALWVRRNLTRAVFPLNWTWNAFIQTSSAGLTPVRYGMTNSVRALKGFTSPTFKKQIEENAYSHIIKSRSTPVFQDVAESLTKLKKLDESRFDKAMRYANFLTTHFEEALTRHAIAAAYFHGKNLGLKGRALWEYASEGGSKTQSMYNYADLPGILRAKELTAIFPFQTFATEMFNTLREIQVPGLKLITGKTGAFETISASSAEGQALLRKRMSMLAKWTAAILVTNSVVDRAIGRKPWEISSFVPFFGWIVGGYSARGPVQHKYISGFTNGVERLFVYGDFKGLRKWFIQYHAPAGVQINRTIEGIEAVALGEVKDVTGKQILKIPPTTGESLKAITMGPFRTEVGKEFIRKRRRTPIQRLEKAIEKRKKFKKGTSKGIKGIGKIKGIRGL